MAVHEIDIWDRALARVGDQRILDVGLSTASTPESATAADPVVVTDTAHGYSTGDLILIRGLSEMVELNGRVFKITKVDANSYNLDDEDGSGYTAQTTTEGTSEKLPDQKISNECYAAWKGSRDEALAEHSWNNCMKRSRLSRLQTAVVVSSATAANPVVCTTGAAHGYSTGDVVLLEDFDEMVEVNDRYFTITVVLATTFSLNNEDGDDYVAESTGGTVKKSLVPFTPDSGYGNRYTKPSDCLRITDFTEDASSTWVIEGDEVLTNAGNTVPIRYIFRQKDVTKYGPALESVLAARLAAEICEVLTHGNQKRDRALQEWKSLHLPDAKRMDAREQSPMPLGEDKWVVARWNRFQALGR